MEKDKESSFSLEEQEMEMSANIYLDKLSSNAV